MEDRLHDLRETRRILDHPSVKHENLERAFFGIVDLELAKK